MVLALPRRLVAGGGGKFIGDVAAGHVHAVLVAHLQVGGALAIAFEVF